MNLTRTLALTLVCAVALILGLSAVAYVGERLVNLRPHAVASRGA